MPGARFTEQSHSVRAEAIAAVRARPPRPRRHHAVRTIVSVTIRLADMGDDDALRKLLDTATLPGEFCLAQRREPSFFAASPALGHRHQVFVAQAGDAVTGMAERSERRVFLNGQSTTVGYLSGVRIVPKHRRGTTLFKGFQFLRGLHDQGDAAVYLTTIGQENEESRAILTSGR